MRNEKVIQLSENRNATVRELRVKDVRRLVGEIKSLTSLDLTALNMTELFGDQFDRLLAIAGDLVEMPQDETAEDLSLSELELILSAMQEVNASFLAKVGLSLELVHPASQSPIEPSETLIEQPVA
jgi:hypothetical protein